MRNARIHVLFPASVRGSVGRGAATRHALLLRGETALLPVDFSVTEPADFTIQVFVDGEVTEPHLGDKFVRTISEIYVLYAVAEGGSVRLTAEPGRY